MERWKLIVSGKIKIIMKKKQSLLPEIEHFEPKRAKSPDQDMVKATTSFFRECLPPFTRAR
tara:strand:- start:362 stop:544 length:183 start_codon:yes stop_codon:yes gene_type:complete